MPVVNIPADTGAKGIVLSPQSENWDMRQFLSFCQANPDMRLERTTAGEIIIMEPAGSDTGRRNIKIAARLETWSENDGTGIAFDSSAGFTLPNGAIRSPDAAWILREKWEALSIKQREGFAPICPDFVVELRSPTDKREDIQAKIREYVANGARLGWLIDPQTKQVEVYKPGHEISVLKEATTLSGEDVLPAFVLDLNAIWA